MSLTLLKHPASYELSTVTNHIINIHYYTLNYSNNIYSLLSLRRYFHDTLKHKHEVSTHDYIVSSNEQGYLTVCYTTISD